MSNFCIIIPIYRTPTICEQTCLTQLLNIVKNYETYLVTPVTKFDTSFFDSYDNVRYLKFPDKYFKSTDSYSELLESNSFWQTFNKFDYVYIVQADVWIFRDEFQKWVDMGFDYIGGPIISNNANWLNAPVVGNGGFSLRKVSKFSEMTSDKFLEKHQDLLTNKWRKYEDLYFIQECGRYTYIDTPIVSEAFDFAWDMNPDVIYKWRNNLPFGIHAVDKNIPFWKHVITELNNQDVINDCYLRNKQFIDVYYENS